MDAIQDKLIIGVVNMNAAAGQVQTNVDKMTRLAREAAAQGCQFLLFPELCVTGYCPGVLPDGRPLHPALAETVDGPTAMHFSALARELGMWIVFGMPESIEGDAEHALNSAFVMKPDGERISYAKIHPVEGDWCAPGSTPMMLETPWGPFGMCVCYDVYAIPELERTYAAQGARLILNPTASSRGFNKDTGDSSGWQWYYTRRLDTIADRDGVYVASANLCGPDGFPDDKGQYPATFPGGSVVVAPIPDEGRYVSYPVGHPGNKEEGVWVGEIDLAKADRAYFQMPVYRPDLYKKWYHSLARRSDKMRIAVSNFDAVWGDVDANLERMAVQIREAAEGGADLVLFPEMALTGYFYNAPAEGAPCMQHRLAETIPGPSSRALSKLAQELGVYVVFGMPEKDAVDGKFYNSAAILTPEGGIQSYRKIHPIGDESRWAEAGDQPMTFMTPWGNIGLSICYDTYFIPELSRFYASQGVKVMLNPTASLKGLPEGRWAWYYTSRLESTADRDGLVIASANLCGKDGIPLIGGKQLSFPGGSVVLSATWTSGVYHGGAVDNNKSGITVSEPIDLSQIKFGIFGFKPELYEKLYGAAGGDKN